MNLIEWIKNKHSKKPLLAQHAVSGSCDAVIVFGGAFFDVKTGKDVTHHVNGIYVNGIDKEVTVFIQHGLRVYQVKMTMEHAEDIGFINVKALSNYC